MPLARYKVDLGGFAGAPGLNVWFFENGDAINADVIGPALRTFYDSVKAQLATGVTVNVPPVAELINEESGALEGFDPQGTLNAVVTGTSAGGLSRATQMKIQARTSAVRDGRLIQGGIFLGPVGETAITTGGEIASAAQTTVVNALVAMKTALQADGTVWVVYSRPLETRVGLAAAVTAQSVWNIPGVQRDRRI